MNRKIELKEIFNIIFKATNKNAKILAHSYLIKDESIISKWKKGKRLPRQEDIDKIVEFIQNESTVCQQKVIRDNMETIIVTADLSSDIKNMILNLKSFESFIREVFSVAVSNIDEIYNNENEVFNNVDSVVKGYVQEENGRYKGILEFDLAPPEKNGGSSLNKSCIHSGNPTEGTTEKRFFRASKLITKRISIIGILVVGVITGSFINILSRSDAKDEIQSDLSVDIMNSDSELNENNLYNVDPQLNNEDKTPELHKKTNLNEIKDEKEEFINKESQNTDKDLKLDEEEKETNKLIGNDSVLVDGDHNTIVIH